MTMKPDLELIKVFLVAGLISLASAVVCPDSSQWMLRTRARCNSSVPSYNCLYDESSTQYVEFCTRRPDFQRPGYKFIIRGNIDGIECEKSRFQPFKFWTNGSFNCILEKTGCKGQGQVIHDEGTSMSDRTCRCDYTRGFAFITRPKQSCFCNPSLEDCSCFLKPCNTFQVMTPDYNCIKTSDWNGIFKCPVISKLTPTRATPKTVTRCETTPTDLQKFSMMAKDGKRHAAVIISVLTVVGITIMIFGYRIANCCLKVSTVDVKLKQIEENYASIRRMSKDNVHTMNEELKKFREKDRTELMKIIKENSYTMDEREKIEEIDMFRMKLKINFRDIVTTINSKEIVHELKLTASERKSIESCLGLTHGNVALLETVRNRGLAFYKEFMKVISQKYPDLAAKIESSKEGEYQEDVENELEKLYNEKIPENVRKFHELQIKDWIVKDKMIIETEASRKVLELLQHRNCVLLVGRPGSGKSSIIRQIALKLVKEYYKEDFDIIPVVIAPSNVLQYYNPSRNQIFILDDFCGKNKVNNQLIDVWKVHIENVLNIINQSDCFGNDIKKARKTKSKFMISCNTTVYTSELFEPLQERLKTFVLELSKIDLTQEEIEKMITKYAPKAKAEDYMRELGHNEFDFPLLCKLSQGKDMAEIEHLFADPHITIMNDLETLQKNDSLQFCAIALCTLFNNDFKVEWLNLNCESGGIHVKNAVKDMCLEFNLDIINNTDLNCIQDQFSREMNWLIKSGDTYHHIHREVFNIALVLCGRSYKRCFINHAPSSFIAKRFSLVESQNELTSLKDQSGLITLKPKNGKLYFDRLFRDLENEITYSTFENSQMKNKYYRTKFIKYCREREMKFKDILGSIKTVPNKDTPNKHDKATLYRQKTFFYFKPPLIDCAMQGFEDMVDLLLEMNCDINITDEFGKSALCVASEKGHFEIVKKLVEKKADISLCDKMLRTSLHMACEEGHEDIARYLIKQGADISASDKSGFTALHLACASGHKHVVTLLVNEKRDEIYKVDNSGQTPLIIASLHGQTDVVIIILAFDQQQVHITDKKGFTPLLAACMNGFRKTVNVLIEKHSYIYHVDFDRRSALFIACEKGHLKIANDLLEKGREKLITICDWHEKSPLYIACVEKRTEIVKLLIRNKANINQCDEDKKTPIYIACAKSSEDIVDFLLKNKAQIDSGDIHKNFPLHVACKIGDLKIVKLLQDHKDCSTFQNKWKETGLEVALKHGHEDIVNFFKDLKKNLN